MSKKKVKITLVLSEKHWKRMLKNAPKDSAYAEAFNRATIEAQGQVPFGFKLGR